MSALDTRHTSRDSMFMVADITFDNEAEAVRVKVRNLSATGMMAQTQHRADVGSRVTIALPNCEDVAGTIAWSEGERVGIAFDEEIDPKQVRRQSQSPGPSTPSYARPAAGTVRMPDPARRFRPV